MMISSVLITAVLFQSLEISSCVEVHVVMAPNDCDDGVSLKEADEPVYVCSNNGKDLQVLLHCCANPSPCLEWTGKWWYKIANNPESSFKKYQQTTSKTVSVYVNNTDYPIRYLCSVTSSLSYVSTCDKGNGYIDIQKGLSPRVTLVNHTRIFDVTIGTTKVSLYFEVFAHPPLNSTPQITVNNSDLPNKWRIIYRSPNMNKIIHYNRWSHFLVEVATEDFQQEDGGEYMLTVSNLCFSSNISVTIKVKCKDTVIILPNAAKSHKYVHTVEGRTVSFTYHCTGKAFNRWGVDGYDISNNPLHRYNFEEINSSVGCVNSFTLTLYDVTLHYSKAYTAYPSMSKQFNKDGVNTTFYLKVLKFPKLYGTPASLLFNKTAYLECTFIASSYDRPNLIKPEWTKDYKQVIPMKKYVMHHPVWKDEEHVSIRLTIKFVSSSDSGKYRCSIKYSTDIIKQEVRSDHGRITLDVPGSSNRISKSTIVIIVLGSLSGALLFILLCITGVLLYKKGIPRCRRAPYVPIGGRQNGRGDNEGVDGNDDGDPDRFNDCFDNERGCICRCC